MSKQIVTIKLKYYFHLNPKSHNRFTKVQPLYQVDLSVKDT